VLKNIWLVIIDGLDPNASHDTQVHILDMIFAVAKLSFSVLVTSRTEQEISTALGDGRIRERLGPPTARKPSLVSDGPMGKDLPFPELDAMYRWNRTFTTEF
jgi:hypothetical protein